MGLNKIDGGNFKVKTQEISIKKIEIKQSVTVTNNPVSNNAVSAKRFEANYQANLRQFALNANVTLANFNPTLSPTEAKAKADDIIRNNGGKNNLNTEAVGQELAEIAKTNPADAWAITQAMLGDRLDEDGKGKVKEGDKDEIAQSFTRSLTEADLKNIANSGDGKSLLERFQSHLLAGNSHADERADALKLETAIKGYPPPQFTGNPEQDIKIIANDLANIPSDKRDDYLIDVMNYGQYGTEVLQHAGVLNDQERDRLANALNQAYQQNPALVTDVLKKSLDNPIQGAIWEQTGLADVIKRTGNDQMIAGYAKHAMGIANSGRVDSYSDTSAISALTALGGMSPEGLQNFINFGSAKPPQYGSPSTIGRFIEQNNANFFKMLNGAIDNYQPWIIGNAVGDLMNVASQMTGADGKLTSEALKILAQSPRNLAMKFSPMELLANFLSNTPTRFLNPSCKMTKDKPFSSNILRTHYSHLIQSPK
ncbi:MAG: hypothetical protein HC846_03660 [Blastocatellia bacterium]|nr:hypothetical protein [Blastocatellia bacterium]